MSSAFLSLKDSADTSEGMSDDSLIDAELGEALGRVVR